MSEIFEVKVPQLSLTSKVNLSGNNGKGSIELDWSGYDIQNKYFVIYRRKEGLSDWEEIVSLEDKFNGNSYIDSLGSDMANPNVPVINIEGNHGANSVQIKQSSIDSGTKYIYYIKAYDSSDISKIVAVSNISG